MQAMSLGVRVTGNKPLNNNLNKKRTSILFTFTVQKFKRLKIKKYGLL
jgi:hypothetical protein